MLKANSTYRSTIRLVIVSRHRLDGDALAALFHAHVGFHVLCTATTTKVAAVVCRHRRPDVVLMDAGLATDDVGRRIALFAQEIGDIPILLLDVEVNSSLLAFVLETPAIGYFTRTSPFRELADGIHRLARGERAFGSVVQQRIHCTENGWQFRHGQLVSPLASLTPREIDVLKLIALGNTVKNCAGILDLAPSTVDNHKCRLMKKLGIHKSLELTRLAVREGLVRP